MTFLTPAFASFAHFAEEHAEVEYSDGGALAEWAWLIVVVPLITPFLIAFFGNALVEMWRFRRTL